MVLPTISRPRYWTSRALSGLAIAFMLMDSTMKVLELSPAVRATVALGFSPESVLTLGVVQLLCTIVYIVPTTSTIGAILLTAYLGGAVATHLRLGSPVFTHMLFPVYIATMIWGGLYLREQRLQQLIAARAS